MVKGNTKQEGINYKETFSPIVKFALICLILAIMAHMDLKLHQMDAKTSFLNGKLNEQIYKEQPIDFIIQGQQHNMLILNRSIYGLRQW